MTLSETLPQRSTEILNSVRSVFAAKGFDGASMQDLARAAGMSAGNFYRYFSSKDEIIAAIADRDLEGVTADFARVLASDDPPSAFRELLRQHIVSADICKAAIWAEIEAAANRRPDLCAAMERMENVVIRNLTAIFARIAHVPDDIGAARFEPEARLVVMLVQGMMKTAARPCGMSDRVRVALADRVMRVIETLLQELAAAPLSEGGK